MLSHEQVRRSVSVDFTVPEEHRDELRLVGPPVGRAAGRAGQAQARPLRPARRGRDYALPLMRSDEVQADRARAAVPDARPRPGRREEPPSSRRPTRSRPDRARAGGRPGRRGDRDGAGRRGGGAAPEFAALAGSLTSGFLLCAVLDDVSRRRVIKFAYDEPLGAAGSLVALLRHAGLHGGGELPRRARRAGRDAGAERGHRRQPDGRACCSEGRATPTGRACTTWRTRAREIEPGLRVRYAHRARRVPRPGDARRVGDRARARAGVGVRRPARDRDVRAGRRSRCCCRSRPCSRAWCCAPASIRWCQLVLAPLPDAAGRGDARRRGRRRGRSRSAARRPCWTDVGDRRGCGRRSRRVSCPLRSPVHRRPPSAHESAGLLPPRAQVPQRDQGAVGRVAGRRAARCRR